VNVRTVTIKFEVANSDVPNLQVMERDGALDDLVECLATLQGRRVLEVLFGVEMAKAPRDPERGAAAAAKLKALGVTGILVESAEKGYITQVACKMPECFCPEELGGACYFEPVIPGESMTDWAPNHEHYPTPKRLGGHRTVDNSVLAHTLCNRIDYSIAEGRDYRKDLERVRTAREAAIQAQRVAVEPE
jgi:hypothetical protein